MWKAFLLGHPHFVLTLSTSAHSLFIVCCCNALAESEPAESPRCASIPEVDKRKNMRSAKTRDAHLTSPAKNDAVTPSARSWSTASDRNFSRRPMMTTRPP